MEDAGIGIVSLTDALSLPSPPPDEGPSSESDGGPFLPGWPELTTAALSEGLYKFLARFSEV